MQRAAPVCSCPKALAAPCPRRCLSLLCIHELFTAPVSQPRRQWAGPAAWSGREPMRLPGGQDSLQTLFHGEFYCRFMESSIIRRPHSAQSTSMLQDQEQLDSELMARLKACLCVQSFSCGLQPTASAFPEAEIASRRLRLHGSFQACLHSGTHSGVLGSPQVVRRWTACVAVLSVWDRPSTDRGVTCLSHLAHEGQDCLHNSSNRAGLEGGGLRD